MGCDPRDVIFPKDNFFLFTEREKKKKLMKGFI